MFRVNKSDYTFDQVAETFPHINNMSEEVYCYCLDVIPGKEEFVAFMLPDSDVRDIAGSGGDCEIFKKAPIAVIPTPAPRVVNVTISTPVETPREECTHCGEDYDDCYCSEDDDDGYGDNHDSYDTSYKHNLERRKLLKSIRDIDKVGSAIITGASNLAIVTDTIEYKGVNLGVFKIKVNLANMSYAVKNVDFTVGDFHHPHIPVDENACYGNMAENIGLAVDEKDPYLLAMFLMEFLQTVNESDEWGEQYDEWPGVANV